MRDFFVFVYLTSSLFVRLFVTFTGSLFITSFLASGLINLSFLIGLYFTVLMFVYSTFIWIAVVEATKQSYI